ncbi:hypothetical protein [Spirosoma utsteinense]|uniref:BZIP transcription factor n=1 Tax=Spirosoma utsteinense TaxID=2585773 RepID=A0ABR6WE19_9BACT|nr:hypothetical protein [Spirosoma utsteinense]MBC3788883.1 hypothetical protein [Spirosoma utsteinense]MBC3794790.1 hypothetical protein [Spirosoma utsteinense]
MKKISLLTLIVLDLVSRGIMAQIIETPANTALTLTSDVSLPLGKSLQVDGIPFLRLLAANTGNVMMGIGAGQTNVSGKLNTFIGQQAGFNAVADSNTFVGFQAGFSTTTGKSNTFFGANAGRGNSMGSRNTFVGRNTGLNSSNGDDNVYLGHNAGQYDQGSRNTFLGQGARVIVTSASPLQNATALGSNAQVSASNSVILGNRANVGIGTTAPQTKLEIVNDEDDKSGLRLSKLTSASSPTLNTNQFLTVDAQGDVVLSSYTLKIDSAKQWSDTVLEKDYALKSLTDVERYITEYKHLPGIPSAAEVVKQGVDITYLNAKLLEKIEELTLYMIELKKADQQKDKRIEQLEKQVLQPNTSHP